MLHSDNDKKTYTIFTRPYPAIAEYEAEIQPFREAGCEVRFSRPRGSHVMELRGCHRELEVSFDIRIPDECREEPAQMRKWLQQIWQQLHQKLEEKKALKTS